MDTPHAYDRRAVLAWSMYDFANSAFTTLVVTFIYSTYFTKVIAGDEITGTTLWSRGVTISAVVIALAAPIMGALADRGNWRKPLLLLLTAIAIIGTTVLYTALPGQVIKALTWFMIANIAFEMGFVLYNAYLPDLAPPDKIGRISGYGWACGYVGGLAALVIALVGFVNAATPWFGFAKDTGAHIRATNLLVAVWFAVFSIPLFIWVKDRSPAPATSPRHVLAASLQQLWQTFRQLTRYRQIVIFLIARLFYNDGLITIFAFGGIYAAGTFGFTFSEIIIFGIVLNLTAGLGAFAFGFLDDKLGGRTTVQISNVGLALAVIIAVLATTKPIFWIAGILVGMFSGPNQAASRSLMARFVPADMATEFYGFYAFSGKATAFLGPLLLGVFTAAYHSQRAGMAVLLVFFVIGGVLLAMVDEQKGIQAAGRG